jgi:DNA-binding transcriptional regulator YhcF (GntR family)
MITAAILIHCTGRKYGLLYLCAGRQQGNNHAMTTMPLLYERLAEELGQLIAQRVFTPGERLPSIRQLALQKRLSISTVMHAMRLLEDRGLVDARPQAGFYVRHRGRALAPVAVPRGVEKPAFVGINNMLMQVLKDHDQNGRVALGSALPPPEMLPNDRVRRCSRMRSILKSMNPACCGKSCAGRQYGDSWTRTRSSSPPRAPRRSASACAP